MQVLASKIQVQTPKYKSITSPDIQNASPDTHNINAGAENTHKSMQIFSYTFMHFSYIFHTCLCIFMHVHALFMLILRIFTHFRYFPIFPLGNPMISCILWQSYGRAERGPNPGNSTYRQISCSNQRTVCMVHRYCNASYHNIVASW